MVSFEDPFLSPERPRRIKLLGVKMGIGTLRERVEGSNSVIVSPDILEDFKIQDTREVVDLMILDFPPSITGPPGRAALKKFELDEEWELAGIEHLVALANALDQDERFDVINQLLGLGNYVIVAPACALTTDGWGKRRRTLESKVPLILRGTLRRREISEKNLPMFWSRILVVRKSRT